MSSSFGTAMAFLSLIASTQTDLHVLSIVGVIWGGSSIISDAIKNRGD